MRIEDTGGKKHARILHLGGFAGGLKSLVAPKASPGASTGGGLTMKARINCAGLERGGKTPCVSGSTPCGQSRGAPSSIITFERQGDGNFSLGGYGKENGMSWGRIVSEMSKGKPVRGSVAIS